MKILIPVSENKGLNSKISPHFGKAPFFILFDTEKNNFEMIENKSEHCDGVGRPGENILKYKPDVIFADGIGIRAIHLFESNNIRIETGEYDTVENIIKNKNKLKQLKKSCEECKH